MHHTERIPVSIDDFYTDEAPEITERQLGLIQGFFQINRYSSVWISRHLGIDLDVIETEIRKLKDKGSTS